jgi:hypothetical protein
MSARTQRVDPNTLALHWNTAYPVGQLVDVEIGGGGIVRTKTTSAAWVSSPPWAAVVDVDLAGVARRFTLSHVTPVLPGAA